MTITLKFVDWCYNEAQIIKRYPQYTRDEWKRFICEQENVYPDEIIKSPKGNGTYVEICGYHFQATSNFSMHIYRTKDDKYGQFINFTMPYSSLNTIEIQDDMLIINELLALK